MHLDSIVHFRKLEPKKKYRYTWVRFDRGKHYDLIDKRARVYDIGGNLLIVPINELCTSESEFSLLSEIQILHSIKSQIEAHIGVQNSESYEKNQIINRIGKQTEYLREGGRAWPNATDLRSVPEEVRRFESGPSHFERMYEIHCSKSLPIMRSRAKT